VEAARKAERRDCLCHNLRYYPVVQQMHQLCDSGELGEILVVQGTYSQDWLAEDTDWNWRVLASAGGPRAVWPISVRTGSIWQNT
jgi:predicted dehydrogenase